MKKRADYRDNTVEELKAKEGDLRKELFNLKFQNATGEIENHMRIRDVKRDIARVLTVINQKAKQGK